MICFRYVQRHSFSCTNDALEIDCISFLLFGRFSVCGTGPTTAAGAIGSAQVVKDFLMMASSNDVRQIDEFVRNNDSFNFYANLNNGQHHVMTGHTGTNVMDLHILYFPSL